MLMTSMEREQRKTMNVVLNPDLYVLVSRAVFGDLAGTLDPKESSVLLALASLVNERNQAWPSHETLAHRSNWSVSSVKRGIEGLEAKELLVRNPDFGNSTTYVLADWLTKPADGKTDRPRSLCPTTTSGFKRINTNKKEAVVVGQSDLGQQIDRNPGEYKISERRLEFVQPMVDYCLSQMVLRGLKEEEWVWKDRLSFEWRYPFDKLVTQESSFHHPGMPEGLKRLELRRWKQVIDMALDAMTGRGIKTIRPLESDLFHELDLARQERNCEEIRKYREMENGKTASDQASRPLTLANKTRSVEEEALARQAQIDIANGWAIARGQDPHSETDARILPSLESISD